MAIRGSCLCGGVTFEIDKAAGPAEFCHCNRCRKVSGSAALLMIGVNTKDYRFLTGSDLVKTYAAPILYGPPAYHSTFCANCGCPVPLPDPEGDRCEIPAGLFDDDPGVKPDKHIFVELLPAWDELRDGLPQYTVKELYKLRTGKELPPDFPMRTHTPPKKDPT
jgi:hypothetical protein